MTFNFSYRPSSARSRPARLIPRDSLHQASETVFYPNDNDVMTEDETASECSYEEMGSDTFSYLLLTVADQEQSSIAELDSEEQMQYLLRSVFSRPVGCRAHVEAQTSSDAEVVQHRGVGRSPRRGGSPCLATYTAHHTTVDRRMFGAPSAWMRNYVTWTNRPIK